MSFPRLAALVALALTSACTESFNEPAASDLPLATARATILPVPMGSVHGTKFCDKNVNRSWDPADEPGVENWLIYLDANNNFLFDAGEPSATTLADGSYSIQDVPPGPYFVREVRPADWIQTAPAPGGNTGYRIVVPVDQPSTFEDLDFGNILLMPTDVRTHGFWQSRNGRMIIEDEFLLDDLGALNLRDQVGEMFDPENINDWRAWLRRANSKNTAYALSAQMAAMQLNIWAGFVQPDDVVLIELPDGDLTLREIQSVVDEANDLLAGPPEPLVIDGRSDLRAQSEFLLEILVAASRDEIFFYPCPV